MAIEDGNATAVAPTCRCEFFGEQGECIECITSDQPKPLVKTFFIGNDKRQLAGEGLPACHELVRGRLEEPRRPRA